MKNSYTNKVSLVSADSSGSGKGLALTFNEIMKFFIRILIRLGLLKKDLDYHLVRASMVIIYFFFGYQKWFAYEAQRLIPFISSSPSDVLDVPTFGNPGGKLVFGGFRMIIWRTLVLRILE
jgi:Protein of unknown function, DUF417